jgi:hypothetical protein
LEELKGRLLKEALRNVWDSDSYIRVRRAANDAVALSWATAYPLLVFPALFEEKVEEERRHAARQARVRRMSRELLVA